MIYPDDFIDQIICGDCLEVMQGIPDKSIDLVLTDPPYGINYLSNMRGERFNRIINDENDYRLVTYPILNEKLKEDSVALIFCSFKNYSKDYLELTSYFDVKNCIIWDKGGGGIGDLFHSLLTDYEMVIVAHKGKCLIRGKRDGSVWNYPKVPPSKMIHPTQKPIELIKALIEKFSDENDLILDPFLGSGTTALACLELNRHFIGIELSPEYCEIARNRISKIQPQLVF